MVSGEAGGSDFKLTRALDSVHHEFSDFFYDGGAKATYKPWNLTLGVSYRNVGYNFNSPMAQTRRIASPSGITLSTFPVMNDGTTARPVTLYDFYSQEQGLYNQSISTTLMNYYVQYNMVEPYGRATPNRKGFTFNADISDKDKIINAGIEVNLLSEVVSEGDSVSMAKRQFKLIRGGLLFNVNKLVKFEKDIIVNAGIRTESSVRKGTNAVNLSSTLIDLGLDVEVFKDLHLLGGTKWFAVKGNEVQTGRDALNQIVTFGPGLTFNQTQRIIASGLRYDYDETAYFCMQYQLINYDDKEIPKDKFNLHQWFFVFGLKF